MIRTGFPSLGSWVNYGLGTENQDLPGFVVMYDYRGPIGGALIGGQVFCQVRIKELPLGQKGHRFLI